MMLSMKAMGKRFGLLAALGAALLIASAGVVVAQSSAANGSTASNVSVPTIGLPNGGFESGDFSHWIVANRPGDEPGDWFVYSGTTTPLSGSEIAAPPQGNFAATTDQDDPGTHVLFRNITLAPGLEHKLSFYLYYQNQADRFVARNTLDFRVEPNQQYRVDILGPNAKPFTLSPEAIRATPFRTHAGDPNSMEPTLLTFNLTRFGGQTVRLRFAEVDNLGPFQASVDRVRLTSTLP
jgi:hypothetical protein